MIGADAVKLPVMASTSWKPSTVLITLGRPGVMIDWPPLMILMNW